MRKKTVTLLTLFASLALAALPAQAATEQGYAETSKEAVELFVRAVCDGDIDGVIRQLSRVDEVDTPAFEIWLERNSEECQRYGGIQSMEFDTNPHSGDSHGVIYHFGNGTSSERQSHSTERQNGVHRVRSSDSDICDKESCFD